MPFRFLVMVWHLNGGSVIMCYVERGNAMDSSQKKRRKRMRLESYNYKQPGSYAITICTKQRKNLFTLPALRSILYKEWAQLPQHYPGIVAGTFVVMHNHLHGILILKDGFAHEYSVSRIMGGYKSLVANAWLYYLYETGHKYPGKIWQSSFYDHVIRNDIDFKNQATYIRNNPVAYKAKKRAQKHKHV
ncbi:REP-associated tyrosine transposase [Dictyobacter halimunensis]